MYLEWSDGVVALRAADDFKAFKIVVGAPVTAFAGVVRDFRGIARFDDEKQAWVATAALGRLLPGGPHADWLASLERMIDKARPHGWIDAASGDIKAHVEWAAETPGNHA